MSFMQSRLYTDMGTLFRDTIAKNPRAWAAHVVLGNRAFAEKDLPRAEAHYRIALQEKPGYWEAQNGLGIVLAVRGRLDEAIALFGEVLEAKPEHAQARRNLELARRQKADAVRETGNEPRGDPDGHR
jgi:Flp pilus assembly protein TadD